MSKQKGRFVMVPYYVAENPHISLAAKGVYLALKTHLPNIFCSIPRLQKMTGCSKRTVLRAIDELLKWQLIKKEKRKGKSNVYSICLKSKNINTEQYIALIKTSSAKLATTPGAHLALPPGAHLAP